MTHRLETDHLESNAVCNCQSATYYRQRTMRDIVSFFGLWIRVRATPQACGEGNAQKAISCNGFA